MPGHRDDDVRLERSDVRGFTRLPAINEAALANIGPEEHGRLLVLNKEGLERLLIAGYERPDHHHFAALYQSRQRPCLTASVPMAGTCPNRAVTPCDVQIWC